MILGFLLWNIPANVISTLPIDKLLLEFIQMQPFQPAAGTIGVLRMCQTLLYQVRILIFLSSPSRTSLRCVLFAQWLNNVEAAECDAVNVGMVTLSLHEVCCGVC